MLLTAYYKDILSVKSLFSERIKESLIILKLDINAIKLAVANTYLLLYISFRKVYIQYRQIRNNIVTNTNLYMIAVFASVEKNDSIFVLCNLIGSIICTLLSLSVIG